MIWKYLHKTSEGNTWLDHRLTPEVRAMLAAMASRAPLGGVEARYEQIVTDLMKDVSIPEVDESEIQRQAVQRRLDPAPMLDRARLEREERIKAAREAAEDSLCVYPVAPRVQRFFDDYVGQYGHSCYDDQTEVLVKHDNKYTWMTFADAMTLDSSVKEAEGQGIEIATFINETEEGAEIPSGKLEFARPSQWTRQPFHGKLYHVHKKNSNVDLAVTANHRMFVGKKIYQRGTFVKGQSQSIYKWRWDILKAEDIAEKSMTRYLRVADDITASQTFDNPLGLDLREDSDKVRAFGELCGYFVGDGHAGGRQVSYLSFNVRKKRKQDQLDNIAYRLGLETIICTDGTRHLKFQDARDWMRTHFYNQAKKKQIPTWALEAGKTFREGMWFGLVNSDGSVITKDSWNYSSNSKQVIESVQILGMGLGRPVSIKPANKQGIHVAFLATPGMGRPVVNQSFKEDSWIDYEGEVFCATVPSGLLFVRRKGSPIVCGNSILELTGSPAVYTEQISVMTTWLLFDSPLCAGQEFSTRAVSHKDWPLAREARGDKELESLHADWMSVFEAELAHWTETFKNPDERVRFGLKDKEPFRPALDRARWALPGTIATGCSQTSHLRDRARVIDVATALSTNAPTVRAVIDGIRDTYREAVPGLANLGLKEAVYAGGASVPAHLERMFEVTEQSDDGPVIEFHHRGEDGPTLYLRKKNRSYADYSQNFDRASVTIPCSLAAARDWHRHRTLFPWWMTLETGEDDCFRIDPHYTPMTEYAAKKMPALIRRSQKVFNRLREEQGWVMACMALPLGTRVNLYAQGGVRDVLYMLELRAHAEGANFEYREQAEELLRQFRIGPFGKLFV